MAAEKKKTTTKTGGKTTAAKTKKPAQPEPAGIRREVWAVIWGVCGLLTLLTLLPIDGAVLHVLHRALGALLGVGLYILPFALLLLCALLFMQRKGPVRLRAACVALEPLFLGAMIHGVIWAREYALESKTLPALLTTGAEMQSGGLLCGLLYIILEWALSWFGAVVVLLVLSAGAALIAARITPTMLWDMFRPPEYEYESEEEREQYEAPPELPNIHVALGKRKKPNIANYNIPLDDEKPAPPVLPEEDDAPAAVTVAQAAKKKKPISPDQFLRDQGETEEPFHDILDLVQVQAEEAAEPDEPEPPVTTASAGEIVDDSFDDTPPWEDKPKPTKAEEKKEAEKVAAQMAAQMDESQQAPVPPYVKPPLDLLSEGKQASNAGVETELKENSARLVDTLESFGVDATIIGIVRGPSVTRFELTISRGVKLSRITALADDIALSLGAVSVRIAPIPDKVATIGIEVPNKTVNMVAIRECIGSRAFRQATSKLSFAVGKDITGAPVIGDIAKMPHLLIAGTTGSGKSVCVNSMLISLLYNATPEEVRLIMVDPKMVELGNYNGIPHLLIPVVTDPKKAAGALNWSVGEMERRYKLFADNQVRNLAGYNDLMREKKKEAQHTEGGAPEAYQVLPQIVIVIDELADLMMVAAKEVETSICRIAQKARAAGMHLIVATQRPSADVITGIMKANIPSRIAFAVASQIESRIILDQTGAEKLIGKGDMLYAPLGGGKPQRIQGCFISSDEIESVIAKIKESATAEYNEEILEHIEKQYDAANNEKGGGASDGGGDEDEMLMEAIDVVMDCGQASVSMLQRRLKLGYSRAARIVDQMEERGIVGPFEGSKPRQILISKDDWKEMKLRQADLP